MGVKSNLSKRVGLIVALLCAIGTIYYLGYRNGGIKTEYKTIKGDEEYKTKVSKMQYHVGDKANDSTQKRNDDLDRERQAILKDLDTVC
jgi:hypothetical protein